MAFGVATPDALLTTAGKAVEWLQTHQYLGVWLDSKLTLDTQIQCLKSRLATRTNVLRAMTSHTSGASYMVKLAFYTHTIRSLVNYSASCLITAPPALIKKLKCFQNESFRLTVSAPRLTKIENQNLRAEAQIKSVAHRLLQLTATLVAKMSVHSRHRTIPDKVLAELKQDPVFFKQTWTRVAATALNRTGVAVTVQQKGRDIPHPGQVAPPPW